eukprot:TRINITY_DN1169_c0_g1_i1.p1 TRINITY_DN1169_c0_g1~~TRINITY_DN1169_c0_g1_i1.p1  ORF type:complete len:262 (-),score=46.13 TRINITY_DN1169_c0_g1_i1:289-1074(-)
MSFNLPMTPFTLLLLTCCLLGYSVAEEILVNSCRVLDKSGVTYKLSGDIEVSATPGFTCLDIIGHNIILDGNGHEISSSTLRPSSSFGIRFSGSHVTVKNMRVKNFYTGLLANGKHGKVHNNLITKASTGIDVTATHNDISFNVIRDFVDVESPAGIYVYFPSITPVASDITISHNVISDISGETFVLGISLYYAKDVYIAQNSISNISGGFFNEAISINSDSEAKLVANTIDGISSGLGGAHMLDLPAGHVPIGDSFVSV